MSSTAPSDRRARLRELAREHRARPGRRVGRLLDALDLVEVTELEPSQRDAHGPSRLPRLRVRLAHVDGLDRRDRAVGVGEGGVERRPRQMARVVVGWDHRAACLEHLAIPDRATADAERPRASTASGRRAFGPGTKTSPRRASITGSAPSAPAASASRVETPAPSTPSASARPRGTESPTRVPVKLPGPVPTTSASSSRGLADACRNSASTSSRSVAASDERSPSTSPSETSALVATSVAVSKARISTGESL